MDITQLFNNTKSAIMTSAGIDQLSSDQSVALMKKIDEQLLKIVSAKILDMLTPEKKQEFIKILESQPNLEDIKQVFAGHDNTTSLSSIEAGLKDYKDLFLEKFYANLEKK